VARLLRGSGPVMWCWHTHKSFIATPRPGSPPPASSSSSLKALPRPWFWAPVVRLCLSGFPRHSTPPLPIHAHPFRLLFCRTPLAADVSGRLDRPHCHCHVPRATTTSTTSTSTTSDNLQPPPTQTCGRSGSVTAGSRPHATFGHGSLTVGNALPAMRGYTEPKVPHIIYFTE